MRYVHGSDAVRMNPDDPRLRRHGLDAFFRTDPDALNGAPHLRRDALQSLARASISRSFAAAGIAHLELKGSGLAQLLYPDAHMRQSNDIDILVHPEQFRFAAERLTAAGWVLKSPPHPVGSMAFALAARAIKDALLVHSTLGTTLELHQRLIFARGLDSRLGECHPELRPQSATREQIPSTPIGGGLLHYLLCHGAISAWARLKWLVDIWLLAPRLSPAHWQALQIAARRCRTEASVKASLLLLCRVFDAELPRHVQIWVETGAREPAVAKRFRFYMRHLHNPTALDTPLAHRGEALKSALFVCTGVRHRIEVSVEGAISSALRNLIPPGRNRHEDRAC